MRKSTGIGLLSFAVIICLSSETLAQRGGFGGRRGGGGFDRKQMEQMRARAETMQRADVAWLWTVISFRMDLGDDQMMAMGRVLKSTWNTKETYISDAFERDANWEAMAEEMKEVEKTMNRQVEEILTREQGKQLKDMRKTRKRMLESMRPGGR